MQDKNETEKHWQNIYLTHKFVERFLKGKMYREMEKFNIVENAFKNIKIATGINNADNFVHKYLHK